MHGADASSSSIAAADEDAAADDEVPVVFYRVFPGAAAKATSSDGVYEGVAEPWIMDVEDEIPTLDEALRHSPGGLGFSVELKFPASYARNHTATAAPPDPVLDATIEAELGVILDVCREHAVRDVYFSSFNPDAALAMRSLVRRRKISSLYNVFFLSSCTPGQADARRTSVAAAIKTAVEGLLAGVVLRADVFEKNPNAAAEVMRHGLAMGTYGVQNDDETLVTRQVLEWGITLVCTDNVAALAASSTFNEDHDDDNNRNDNDDDNNDDDAPRVVDFIGHENVTEYLRHVVEAGRE